MTGMSKGCLGVGVVVGADVVIGAGVVVGACVSTVVGIDVGCGDVLFSLVVDAAMVREVFVSLQGP